MSPRLFVTALAVALAEGVLAGPSTTAPHDLVVPRDALGASIGHSPSYSSFSFEPAFWVEFFGNESSPNAFTFDALSTLHSFGGRPNIRPGGETMDSMIFDPSAGNPVRTTSPSGGVYRTTVGPPYYKSWSNFPAGTMFTSTLNLGNDSLDIARNMAVASIQYQPDLVAAFELGNEPNNYPESRWNDSTEAYVTQWKEWTSAIDTAVNAEADAATIGRLGTSRWWASSATTDDTALQVKPASIIPAGIDSGNQVSAYSIHSYAFASCDPTRAALASIENVLNHTGLVEYAQTEIEPSAQAALASDNSWIIGEFNSIACSGKPNVSDTFTQALWQIDTELIYAVRNASACYLHQGATLVFQSSDQLNSAGANGTPGYSTYDMLYPSPSELRGAQRALPAFAGLVFLAEAFATNNSRVRALDTPDGVNPDHFSAYAFYNDDKLSKLALLNLKPYYGNTTDNYTVTVNVLPQRSWTGSVSRRWSPWSRPPVLRRLTAPAVNEKDAARVTWAGQSFADAKPSGDVVIERVDWDGVVRIRGSEAVLVYFDQ